MIGTYQLWSNVARKNGSRGYQSPPGPPGQKKPGTHPENLAQDLLASPHLSRGSSPSVRGLIIAHIFAFGSWPDKDATSPSDHGVDSGRATRSPGRARRRSCARRIHPTRDPPHRRPHPRRLLGRGGALMHMAPQRFPLALAQPRADHRGGLFPHRFAQRQQPPGHHQIHRQHPL